MKKSKAPRKRKPAKKSASKKPLGNRPRGDYDGAKTTGKRRTPISLTKSEAGVLPSGDRRKLIATTRDLRRNFSIAAWAIRKHLDYVSSFNFQCRSGVPELNTRIEDLMDWWALPENCDIAGRHPLRRMIRIGESSRTLDGDVLFSRLRSGHLQGIEGDRCTSSRGAIPEDLGKRKVSQGVELNAQNRALAYYISKRGDNGFGMKFEKRLPAQFVDLLAYFDRFDQVRGVSPMAPAINTYRDLYESFDYALSKAKVGQLFGLMTFRGDPSALVEPNDTGKEDVDGNPRYNIDFGEGPYHLDLDDGDRAEILESKSPSSEFQKHMQEMIAAALKALDIPYSFYNESFTNFSGARQAWLLYDQSAESKRGDLRAVLNRITRWKLAQWIATGLLVLPDGMDIRSLKWEWIATGIPWIDPLKEVQADKESVNYVLNSRQRICKRRGEDFFEIAEEVAVENFLCDKLGIPAYGPSPGAPLEPVNPRENPDTGEED